jgi:Na+/glutamate symporter
VFSLVVCFGWFSNSKSENRKSNANALMPSRKSQYHSDSSIIMRIGIGMCICMCIGMRISLRKKAVEYDLGIFVMVYFVGCFHSIVMQKK